ncbi:hypothetical protein PV327_003524 [Microctonus hyperodae]|uniref:RING-type domain-containing protein n=1 Tax=Microctonus hyperodae TaxID=165561 RepID=A0AA39G481_MICHY|nr:hypothetical protein PV327_003524 [Microctonus hyperodae]
MANIYPSLDEKFKCEGICPICLMAMGDTPKYTCTNGHEVCHRCKPYYYACPTCQSPLNTEILPTEVGQYHMPPSIHYMPHPYPPYPPSSVPSAPFIDNERQCWSPPTPTEDQILYPCQYSAFGCYAKIPQHIRELHESRCQFRPNLEDENLPTDLSIDEGALEKCKYHVVGCNVKLAVWRKLVHEKICIYKDKLNGLDEIEQSFNSINFDDGNPEDLVDCKFRQYGCMVRMPRRRKQIHEEKCNYYKDYHEEYETEEVVYYFPESVVDPNEPVPCCWADYGCQVQPRQCRKEIHEEKCNYRRFPCRYTDNGCREVLELTKKHLHESSCSYS